jgi:flagellar protein FlaE/flagellar protein FlaC
MELLDRLLNRDDDEGSGSDGSSGDDDMFFEEDEGDLDGFGGGDGFDDELGFDEGGDDGGAATAELEGRIDEMENEVASLSSTVSTIRSENEEISNTVEDVEENVRKLLDIYEMVTRGVNPFVDDAQASGGGFDGQGNGSLGLFDDDGDDDEAELDDDIAGADAEDFFDDDFLDEGDGDGFGDFDEPSDDAPTTEDTMADDSDDSDDSGKSFEELKNEYESGDADWAEDDDVATNGDADETFEEGFGEVDVAADDADETVDEEFAATNGDDFADDFGETGDLEDFDDGEFEDPAPEPDPDDTLDETPDGPTDEAPATAGADAGAAQTAAERTADAGGAGDLQFAANTLMDGSQATVTKPYLNRLPSGYVGDLLVLEWLEYLVEESDVADAARAVEYYRRIQWVGEDAADELHDFLVGFGEVDDDVTGAPSALSIDHHVASLRYISRLTGSTADSIVFECWSGDGGVPFGL